MARTGDRKRLRGETCAQPAVALHAKIGAFAISAVHIWVFTALAVVPTKVLIFKFCFRALNEGPTYYPPDSRH